MPWTTFSGVHRGKNMRREQCGGQREPLRTVSVWTVELSLSIVIVNVRTLVGMYGGSVVLRYCGHFE